jgi:predicted DNA-binding transcriptional regulator YafY
MSGPTTRVLALLELLQAHGRLNGAELADKLDVDRRTVRRYMNVLEELGIPVTTEQGRHGGYMLVAGFKLPPMMFTDEETLAISLGLLAVEQLGLAEAASAVGTVQAKLERVMPVNLKHRVREVSETTKLILPRAKPMPDSKALMTLTKAIQTKKRVSFVYQAPQAERIQREMDPYGLVFRWGNWYASGYCHLRQDLRLFRLDRISNVKPLPAGYERPAGFNAAEHLRKSFSSMPGTLEVAVLLHTDMNSAADAFGIQLHSLDMVQPQQDGLLLRMRTDSVCWFAWWLARLPFTFKILDPPELKAALRQHAERLLEAC